jgi:hypothetical protein
MLAFPFYWWRCDEVEIVEQPDDKKFSEKFCHNCFYGKQLPKLKLVVCNFNQDYPSRWRPKESCSRWKSE